MTFRRIRYLLLVSLTLILTNACDPYMVYDQYQKIDKGSWKWDDKKVFTVNMQDTLTRYNILINIRHTTDYPKSNLFLFVTTHSPFGGMIRDTLEVRITDPKGKWLGKGFGHIKLISRMYKKDILFANKGDYTFTIEQGMRLPEVPVTDVGLRIEKYKVLK